MKKIWNILFFFEIVGEYMSNLITVVIPIFNVERYIAECIESVLHQTYSNIEIILVDDGSTDNCPIICDNYAKKDNRITVIHKKNGGLSDARNAGIDIATGEYLTLVDSDDFILPDMISKMVELASDNDADLIECRNIRCDENDTLRSIKERERQKVFSIYEDNEKMMAFFNKAGSNTAAWGKLYRITLFENVRYPVGKLHEDVFTTYKLLHKAKKLVITEYAGYVYRKNSNSITGNPFTEKKLDTVEGKLQQAEFIENHYPELINYAYSDVIYACNYCMIQIAKSNYKDKKKVFLYLKKYYKKYGRYYLKSKNGLTRKAVCLISMISMNLSFLLLRAIRKKL